MELIIFVAASCYGAYWWGKRSRENYSSNLTRDADVERLFSSAGDTIPVLAHLEIDYRDVKGARTHRRIRVRRFTPGRSHGMINAFCHLRHDYRSFRTDRVRKCIDLETGEIVKDTAKHLSGKHEKSPSRVLEMLMRKYRDVIRVLGYVARVDGPFDDSTSRIVAAYVSRLSGDEDVTPSIVVHASALVGKTTLRGFKGAVGRVVNAGAINPILLAGCCREVIEADGKITQKEQEALDYLDRRILSEPSA